MEPHDLQRTLRRLEPGGWTATARRFATTLRTAGHEPGRLLVLGTPDAEPWHLTAHLDQAARFRDLSALQPVLVRWSVPEGAPPHLSVGVDVVARAGRGSTVLVAAASAEDEDLLERLDDARRGGAVLLAVHGGGGPLDDLAHDALALPPVPDGFGTATHALSSPALYAAPRRRLLGRRRA
ncbi:MAG: hypothetical protein JWM64_881 [Frankiales bacterium]|nr:hypothetical protein [Frankiales bacterium]